MNTTKKWEVEEIKKLIETNDEMVIRSLRILYTQQTNEEKNCQATIKKNGKGFNGHDAKILSSFVEFYNQRKYLSVKQIEFARKRLIKYSKQLTNLANNMN